MSNPINSIFPESSPLIYGCMGLGGGWNTNPLTQDDLNQCHQVVDTALEAGINYFDHADIYSMTKAETVFGQVLAERPELRDQMIIQSKCGIRLEDENAPGRYDFSKEHIEYSIDVILKRLQIETLDILLLHRPDPLMEPAEIAETFEGLQKAGKVKLFGVSNMNGPQMDLLQDAMKTPLVVNQLELSLRQSAWIDETTTANCAGFAPSSFVSGSIEYCRKNNVQVQSWGSLAQGLFSGRDVSNEPEHIQKTAQLVKQLAGEYQVSTEAIVLAWLMRHPANIQPVIGTTNLDRIKACASAPNITLTRDQWYKLYVSSLGRNLP